MVSDVIRWLVNQPGARLVRPEDLPFSDLGDAPVAVVGFQSLKNEWVVVIPAKTWNDLIPVLGVSILAL